MKGIDMISKNELRRNGIRPYNEVYDQKGKLLGYEANVDLSVLLSADYQRGVDISHCEKIEKDFQPRACEPLTLSYRPTDAGGVWNVNGGHRQTVLLNLGYHEYRAMVHVGMNYNEEAKLFFTLNDAPRRMNGWTKFKAAIKAGNVVFKRLVKTANSHGLTTPMSPGVKLVKHADIKNQAALLHAFKNGGLPMVDIMCKVLAKCWKKDGVVPDEAKQTDILRGLCSFLNNHYFKANGSNRLSWNTIHLVLSHIPPAKISQLAKKQKSKGRPDARQFHDAFCELFEQSKVITSTKNLMAA
jgi:hypothetical protein